MIYELMIPSYTAKAAILLLSSWELVQMNTGVLQKGCSVASSFQQTQAQL